MKKCFLGLVSVGFIASTMFAGNYNVDLAHTNVTFKVKHLMISNVKGAFTNFNGSFEYDEKMNVLKSLNATVDANSINTDNQKRDEHLKSADFFEVEKYKTVLFVTSKIVGDKVYGKLTIKGVTKDVIFELENGGTVKDPWGNMRAGFSIEGEINRKDYGLTWNKVLEAGGVTVGENVKINIEVEGILAK